MRKTTSDAQAAGSVATVEVQSVPREGLRHVAGRSVSLLKTRSFVIVAVHAALALVLFGDQTNRSRGLNDGLE